MKHSLFKRNFRKIPVALCGLSLLLFRTGCLAKSEAAPSVTNPLSFSNADWINDTIIHPRDPCPVIPGKDPNDWFLVVEPQFWLPSVSGTVAVRGLPSVDVNKKANLSNLRQVLSHLDSAVGGKLEVRKGRWGLFGDGFFAQLSDTGAPPGPLYSNAAVVNKVGTASLSLAYRFLDDRRWFLDVYAGARYNYLGLAINTSTDTTAIQDVSQEAVSRLSQQIANMVDSVAVDIAHATQQAISSNVQKDLSQGALDQALQNPSLQAPDIKTHLLDLEIIRRGLERMDRSDRRDRPNDFGRYVEAWAIRDSLVHLDSNIQNLVDATAEERLALAQAKAARDRNQLTAAIQNTLTQAHIKVAQAQNNLASALSQKIQSNLPTAASGSQQWVDPLVGMRGQINMTRVLFLACGADAGGFGAGSQITWNATASVGVNFTRQVFGEIGYRYNYTDYSNNSGFLYKGSEYGTYVGIGFKL